MNVLYIGVDNPISFAVDNTNCNDLNLAIENGTASKIDECSYNILVTKGEKTLIFIIKGNDTISKTLFRVKKLPQPILDRFENESPWLLLDSIRSQKGLRTTMENFGYDANFSVSSFEFMVLRNKKLNHTGEILCNDCLKKIENGDNEVIYSGTNQGENFNESLQQFIQHKLMIGDRIYIEEIKVLTPDNRLRKINSITFTII